MLNNQNILKNFIVLAAFAISALTLAPIIGEQSVRWVRYQNRFLYGFQNDSTAMKFQKTI